VSSTDPNEESIVVQPGLVIATLVPLLDAEGKPINLFDFLLKDEE